MVPASCERLKYPQKCKMTQTAKSLIQIWKAICLAHNWGFTATECSALSQDNWTKCPKIRFPSDFAGLHHYTVRSKAVCPQMFCVMCGNTAVFLGVITWPFSPRDLHQPPVLLNNEDCNPRPKLLPTVPSQTDNIERNESPLGYTLTPHTLWCNNSTLLHNISALLGWGNYSQHGLAQVNPMCSH